ncbi:MAG TPA: RsmD family RNA methyltransferase [Phycisphaerae bacterium]|nr:RsmD family RNA methyltransferase [Phycisphaerae bacterium]
MVSNLVSLSGGVCPRTWIFKPCLPQYHDCMRIIAGQYRGRTIEGPPSDSTRPILDRARVVLFDMLGTRLAEPGRLPPVTVLDLFCGTGTLGIEALSRGARYCRFVEQHRGTVAVLRRNLDTLRIGGRGEISPGDATAGRFSRPPPDEAGTAQYGLVFVDPPYRLMQGQRPAKPIQGLLERLATSEVIAPPAVIVVRHDARGAGPDLSPLIETDARTVGTMTLRFTVRPDAPKAAAGRE